jgi:hypothetical protein
MNRVAPEKAPFLAKPEANGRHLANSGFPQIYLPLARTTLFPATDGYWLALYYCDRCVRSGKWKVETRANDGSRVGLGEVEKAVNPVGCVKTNG